MTPDKILFPKKLKRLLLAIVFLSQLTLNAQNRVHDIGISLGFADMQTDFGTSETSKSTFANFGSHVSLDYTYHLFESFNYTRTPMYRYLWGHLMLRSNISYSYMNLEYFHESEGDPIFTGELPNTVPLEGHANLYSAGVGLEYHFINLLRFYSNRTSIKFSPYVGFMVQYSGAQNQTNVLSNYENYYGLNGDGQISDDEIPFPQDESGKHYIPGRNGERAILDYDVNPIAEKNLSSYANALYQLYPDSARDEFTPEEAAYRAQLFRYAGMNRPNFVNTIGLNFSAGIRITLSRRLDLNAQGNFVMFLSDDMDGLNMPWRQNQAKETLVNLNAGLLYRL